MQKEVRLFYNNLTDKKNGYEKDRWFKNEVKRAGYKMTKKSINRFVVPIGFSKCLELGPGHGTWTKELLAGHPHANFTLVDLSAGMLGLARKRFKDEKNIRYFESDFLEFKTDEQYDLFFSIRAIEYIPNKDKMTEKILSLLTKNGYGFIITKTPKYLRNKILGRTPKDMHKGQITPTKIKKMLKKAGAIKIMVYPVTMSWPFWRSVRINFLLHKIFYRLPLNFISKFFSESYCVIFQKK